MSCVTIESEAAERDFGRARVGQDFTCEMCEYPFPLTWPTRTQSEDDGGEFCSDTCRTAAEEEA